jgi:hypothetical protein
VTAFKSLEDSIKKIYPKCEVIKCQTCTITEPDEQSSIKSISLGDIREYLQINNTFIKPLAAFFNENGSDNIFNKDCDGIVLLKYNNKKYCLLIELKSTFDTERIYKAKNQIMSSYIKLNMSLGLLADYHKDEFEYIGIIVSQEPNDEDIAWMQREEIDSRKLNEFAINLFLYKQQVISYDKSLTNKGLNLSDRYMYQSMKYCYIGIPPKNSSYEIDIAEFL